MTRREFEEDVTTWSELMCFVSDNSLYNYAEEIYHSEAFESIIIEDIQEASSLDDIRRILNDAPDGYDYYMREYYGWVGLDDGDGYFTDLKEEILNDFDIGSDMWDEEEPEEEPEEEFEEIIEPPLEPEAISLDEVIEDSSAIWNAFTPPVIDIQEPTPVQPPFFSDEVIDKVFEEYIEQELRESEELLDFLSAS